MQSKLTVEERCARTIDVLSITAAGTSWLDKMWEPDLSYCFSSLLQCSLRMVGSSIRVFWARAFSGGRYRIE